jgi:hypothetical protein
MANRSTEPSSERAPERIGEFLEKNSEEGINIKIVGKSRSADFIYYVFSH